MEAAVGTSLEKAVTDKSVKCTMYEKMVTTLVTLHRHTDGTLFLLCQKTYFVFTRADETADYQMSNSYDYKKVEGVMPMTECLALKPSLDPSIFYFM